MRKGPTVNREPRHRGGASFSEKSDELLADLTFHGLRHVHISRMFMDGMHSFEDTVSGEEISTS